MRPTCLLAIVLLVLGTGIASPQPASPPPSPQTTRELGQRWWRWRVALPGMALPDKDAAGHFCDVGQSKDTWFLAGLLSFGPSSQLVSRSCVVPAGRRLFFPVATVSRITHDAVTCEKAQAQVTSSMDRVGKIVATLDGADLLATHPVRWSTDGRCLALNLPADGPSAALTAAVDGYWLLLDPLPAGRHTLVFGGSVPSSHDDADRLQATTYALDVE